MTTQRLKAHVFVCTNDRPAEHPRGCCKGKNSELILQAFKQEISKAGLAKEIRAQKAGCLDTCEFGPAVVIYPDNIWYGSLSVEDVPEIVKNHLVEGHSIDRLKMPGK